MFYTPEEGHSLPHNPFKAIVAPRPIGWISTIDNQGQPNLAPYSFFNGISDVPMMLMFSSAGMKDSARNARDTGEFTFNYVSRSMQDSMNVSSATFAHGVNEFEKAELEMVGGKTVACPRVKGVAAAMECRVTNIFEPTALSGEKAAYSIIVGQVTGIFIDDGYITDEGRFDLMKADPILRAGYHDYVSLDKLFELRRPD